MKEFIDKLIERLEEEKSKGHYDSNSVIGEKNCWNRAIEIVNELAEEYINCSTDTSTNTSTGWIPCSERLPEAKKEVLIFADDNAMFVGRLMNGGFSVHDGDGWIDLKFILAWMPLPAPYTEGE